MPSSGHRTRYGSGRRRLPGTTPSPAQILCAVAGHDRQLTERSTALNRRTLLKLPPSTWKIVARLAASCCRAIEVKLAAGLHVRRGQRFLPRRARSRAAPGSAWRTVRTENRRDQGKGYIACPGRSDSRGSRRTLESRRDRTGPPPSAHNAAAHWRLSMPKSHVEKATPPRPYQACLPPNPSDPRAVRTLPLQCRHRWQATCRIVQADAQDPRTGRAILRRFLRTAWRLLCETPPRRGFCLAFRRRHAFCGTKRWREPSPRPRPATTASSVVAWPAGAQAAPRPLGDSAAPWAAPPGPRFQVRLSTGDRPHFELRGFPRTSNGFASGRGGHGRGDARGIATSTMSGTTVSLERRWTRARSFSSGG